MPKEKGLSCHTFKGRNYLENRSLIISDFKPRFELPHDATLIRAGKTEAGFWELFNSNLGSTDPQRLYKYPCYRRYLPKGKVTKTIFYIPGNAFVNVESAFTDNFCLSLATESNAQVIALYPRLAPEYSPLQLRNDCRNLLLHFMRYASRYTINTKDIGLVGYSAGANQALYIAISSQFKFNQLTLISPPVDFSMQLCPFEKRPKDKYTTADFIKWYTVLYFLRGEMISAPIYSPAFLDKRAFMHLPPTTIISGSDDFYKPDALYLTTRLQQSDVKVTSYNFAGPHMGLWFNESYARNVVKTIALKKLLVKQQNRHRFFETEEMYSDSAPLIRLDQPAYPSYLKAMQYAKCSLG